MVEGVLYYYMRKPNLYVSTGVVFSIAWMFLKRFYMAHDYIQGFCIGLGLTLIFFGIIFQEYDVIRFFNNKK